MDFDVAVVPGQQDINTSIDINSTDLFVDVVVEDKGLSIDVNIDDNYIPIGVSIDGSSFPVDIAISSTELNIDVVNGGTDFLVDVYIGGQKGADGDTLWELYDDEAGIKTIKYGRLYNWYSVLDERRLIPLGWHIPTESECAILKINSNSNDGIALRTTGWDYWNRYESGSTIVEGTDLFGFSAVGSGIYNPPIFGRLNSLFAIWTSTADSSGYQTIFDISNNSVSGISNAPFGHGLSIRLVKDNSTLEGDILDVDGNVYNTIKIGNQVWTKQNWACTKYLNGDVISKDFTTQDGASIAYNNDDNNSFNNYGVDSNHIKPKENRRIYASVIDGLPEFNTQIQSDYAQTNSTKLDYIKNKPVIPSLDGYATKTFVTDTVASKEDKGVAEGLIIDLNLGDVITHDYDEFALALGPDDNYITDQEKYNLHAPHSDDQDLNYLVSKVPGKSLILDTEIERLTTLHNVDISSKVDKVSGKSLVFDSDILKIHSPHSDDQDLTPYQLLSEKNVNNGYAPLDSGGKIPLANLPSTLLKYIGVWDVVSNVPILISPDLTKVGNVYTITGSGSRFGISFSPGDWLIYNSNGIPEKSDNSDDVVSVNGQTGIVSITPATLGLVIGTDVLAYRTFGTAANSNINDFEKPLIFSTGLSRTGNTIDSTITQYTDALARSAQNIASNTQTGLLTNTDWNTFNNKQNSLTIGNVTSTTPGISITNGIGAIIGSGLAINISFASAISGGLLSSGSWTDFNNKVSFPGFGLISGKSWGYDSHPTTISGYGITDIPTYSGSQFIQNQNSSVQSANMWINGVIKKSQPLGSIILEQGNTTWDSSLNWYVDNITSNKIAQIRTDINDGSNSTTRSANLVFGIKKNGDSLGTITDVLTFTTTSGAATFASTVTATQFNGSGTGLTGVILNQNSSAQNANMWISNEIRTNNYFRTGIDATMFIGVGGAISGGYLSTDLILYNTGGDAYLLGTGSKGLKITGTSGAATFASTVTATQFNGSGAGLTGTASGLTAGNSINLISNNISNTDINTLIYKAGIYAGYNITNSPTTEDFGFINIPTWMASDASNRYNLQIGAVLNSDNINFRTTGLNGIGTWRTIYHSGNSNLSTVDWNAKNLNVSGNISATTLSGSGTRMVVADSNGVMSTQAIPSGGGGGSVVSVGVDNTNGFYGSSSGGSNPSLSIKTNVSGILLGNGTSVSALTGAGLVRMSGASISFDNTYYANISGGNTWSGDQWFQNVYGKFYSNSGGAEMGANSITNDNGASLGDDTYSLDGGACGYHAITRSGGSIGQYTTSYLGGAIGSNAISGNGFAGGYQAWCLADANPSNTASSNLTDSIQLGTGNNPIYHSLKIYGNQLMDQYGNLTARSLVTTNAIACTGLSVTVDGISTNYFHSTGDVYADGVFHGSGSGLIDVAYGSNNYASQNFDSIKKPGLYHYDAGITGTTPNGSLNYRVIELGGASRYSQIAMPFDSDDIFFRRNAGTWLNWRKIWNDGNFNPNSYRLNTYPSSGSYFAGTPNISGSGVMEVGKYIDFHATNEDTSDYSVRLIASSGDISNSGTFTAGNFILSSDSRLKTNIKSISTEILDVNYKEFELISNLGEKRYGVIAQELQQIAPELVKEDENGILSVKYIDLLVKKISELENRIKQLEEK